MWCSKWWTRYFCSRVCPTLDRSKYRAICSCVGVGLWVRLDSHHCEGNFWMLKDEFLRRMNSWRLNHYPSLNARTSKSEWPRKNGQIVFCDWTEKRFLGFRNTLPYLIRSFTTDILGCSGHLYNTTKPKIFIPALDHLFGAIDRTVLRFGT